MLIQDVDRYRVMDPIFESVRVALSTRGEKRSAAYIQGISGSAFRFAGVCPCAPTCSAAMEPEQLVRLLGYEVECAPLCGKGVDPAKEVGKVVARVKEEVRAGRPAIVWHAFTNAEWDVVCGFDEEKEQFLGRGSYAGQGDYATADWNRTSRCDICPSLGAIFIGRKSGRFRARDAELSALEDAVRHAHSPADPFLRAAGDHALPWRFREGLAAYDAYAHAFRADPKRVPGGDRYALGVYRSTRRSAAGFLREIAPKYPAARAHLESAAEAFTADADALDECYEKLLRGWEGWKQPDPVLAGRMAEGIARARAHYARGIEGIAAALETLDPERARRAGRPAAVKRTRGAAVVQGVPRLAWGEGHDCTYIGALEAALKVSAHPYTYSDLMGLSGLAFRARWSNDEVKTKWCHSCAVGEMPDEGTALVTLTGWSLPGEWVEPQGRDTRRLCERVVAAIDRGEPVLSYPADFDMALVTGYEEGGRTLLLRDYSSAEEYARLPLEKLGPLQYTLGDHREPPPLGVCLRHALSAAVANWRRERHNGGLRDREYWYGDAALAAWQRDIRRFDTLPEDTQKTLVGLDRWCFTALLDARRSAARFLKDWATLLDGEPREALLRASGLYEQEGKALEPRLAGKRGRRGAAEWPAEARDADAGALAEARRLEGEAIKEMEKALAAAW